MLKIKEQYKKKTIVYLKGELGLSNVMALPRIEKVVVNTGLGRVLQSVSNAKDFLDQVKHELALITGQQAVLTKARKSIASFKTRAGQPVGLKVTLRGERMYDFLDRLVHVALPRSRDFRGLKENAVDKGGNLTIGIKEHTIFPEAAESAKSIGFEVTVVTNTESRELALKLFRSLGFPIKR